MEKLRKCSNFAKKFTTCAKYLMLHSEANFAKFSTIAKLLNSGALMYI